MESRVSFGQLVIGPPGSGKTTYCHGMAQFLRQLGRPVAVVNLDPANENLPFQPEIDLADLVRLEEVMEVHRLGPNGGLVYCMEFLKENFAWLSDKLKSLPAETYVLIDCPGQVELYTHDDSVKEVIARLEKACGLRLCAVHLVDSHYCSDPSKFISVCLTSLSTMLQLALPHVNVLSKVDQIEKHGRLQFNVDFYTEVLDLRHLLDAMSDDPFAKKYKKMNEVLIDLIENYSLVHFTPLNVNSKERMLCVKNLVDKANGYCFGSGEERRIQQMMSCAMGGADFEYAKTADVREQYMRADDDGGGDGGEIGRKLDKVGVVERTRERLGNDLDLVDIQPGFQI